MKKSLVISEQDSIAAILENERVVEEAMGGAQDKFRIVPPQGELQSVLREDIAFDRLVGTGFFRTFPPQDGTDGFFAALIEHRAGKL